MSKPEKKVYLASQPFICKSNARIILSINHKAMDNIVNFSWFINIYNFK